MRTQYSGETRQHPCRESRNPPINAGFTLLELMVTVMIVGILASIAIPSYRSYIERSALSETQQRLLGVSTELLRWRSKSLTYRGFIPDTGYIQNSEILVPTGSTLSNYRYKLTLVDASSNASLELGTALGMDWVMIASPNSSNKVIKDGKQLYLNSSGQRCLVPSTVTLTTGTNPCGNTTSEPWN